MSYRIEFTSAAQREFLRLPKSERVRIGERIEALAGNPRPVGCTKLSGVKNLWRIRCGNYRVIYSVEDTTMVVAIIKVGHRRGIYRDL